MKCKQPAEKRLEASASEIVIVDNTIEGLKKTTVSPVSRTKVWATDASGVMNLKNYKKWLNAIESELKNTRASFSDVAVVLKSILNIPQKATSTRWAFKIKFDHSSKARQAVLGWRQKYGIDCTLFICEFVLLVIASAKRVNISHV